MVVSWASDCKFDWPKNYHIPKCMVKMDTCWKRRQFVWIYWKKNRNFRTKNLDFSSSLRFFTRIWLFDTISILPKILTFNQYCHCEKNLNCWKTRFLTENFQLWPKFYFSSKFRILPKNFQFWPKFYFSPKFRMLPKNFQLWPKFYFSPKFRILRKNFQFWPKFYFSSKFRILPKNFQFWPKFRILPKNFQLWPKFHFSPKFRILRKNFQFWPKFYFSSKFRILPKNFDFDFWNRPSYYQMNGNQPDKHVSQYLRYTDLTYVGVAQCTSVWGAVHRSVQCADKD